MTDTTDDDIAAVQRIAEDERERTAYGPGMGFGTKTVEEARELIARRNAALGLDKDRATWSPDDVHITRGEQ
jgi:hypothetical protein